MTTLECVQFVRGLVSQPEWVRAFYVPAVRRAMPWPRDMSRDYVHVMLVSLPRWPASQPFARVCGACRWRGLGLPGDSCPSCGSPADDGMLP